MSTCDPKDIITASTANTYTIDTSSLVNTTSYTGSGVVSLPYGISGSTMVSNGTTASWSTPNTHFTASSTGKTVMTIPHSGDEVVIEPAAALNVKGKVIINGEDLQGRLERIETLLNIPIRDVEMEREFPKLKHLWEEYEQELEKYKTWKRLNK